MICVLLGEGFEEIEALTPVDFLRRAGFEVRTVGLTDKTVFGSHGIGIEADMMLSEVNLTAVEMVILPGGLGGVASIRGCAKALELIQKAYNADKYVAAICAGPTVLADLGITDGKNAVCYPGCESNMGNAKICSRAAVQDGKILTGTSVGCAAEFSLLLIEVLGGKALSDSIRKQIVIR